MFCVSDRLSLKCQGPGKRLAAFQTGMSALKLQAMPLMDGNRSGIGTVVELTHQTVTAIHT